VQVDYGGNTYQDPITGEMIANDQLTAFSVFDFKFREILSKPVFSVNKFTVESAANILVRRAVGYAAGMLDYFFRGDLRVFSVSGGIKVQNASTETMASYNDPNTGTSIGKIEVYYDNASGRQFLTSYNLPEPLTDGTFTPVISFTPPTDNIRPGKYIVVFRGKLGQEDGAVIVAKSPYIYYVSYRPDDDNIYRYKIYRMEMDGSNPTVVYDNQDPNIAIGFLAPSPDGSKLAFAVYSPPETLFPTIYLRDMASRTVTPLTTGEQPSWSPNGKQIVFQRETGLFLSNNQRDHEIFKRDIDSGIETQLTSVPDPMNGGSNDGPAWSPDGTKIAIYKNRSSIWSSDGDPPTDDCINTQLIYLITTSGNWIEPLSCEPLSTVGVMADTLHSWSSDGTQIVFQRRSVNPQKSFREIYKVNVQTKVQTKLTDSDGTNFNELSPVWSPDGRVIAVASDRDGDLDIWLIDPNGGGYQTNLTGSQPGTNFGPAFGW